MDENGIGKVLWYMMNSACILHERAQGTKLALRQGAEDLI